MPTANTARSFSGTHATTGYDVNAVRSSGSKKSTQNMNQRKNRRGGRK